MDTEFKKGCFPPAEGHFAASSEIWDPWKCLTSTCCQQPPAWTVMTPSLKRSAGRTMLGMDSECLGVRVGIWVVLCPPLHLSPRLLEVMVAGYPVLLVRNKKEFSALGSKCPHYGAPLSKGKTGSGQGEKKNHLGEVGSQCPAWGGSLAGVLRGERLRCPWHGACFNIRTGDIEEYPALDCIPCFKVTSCPPIQVPLQAPCPDHSSVTQSLNTRDDSLDDSLGLCKSLP